MDSRAGDIIESTGEFWEVYGLERYSIEIRRTFHQFYLKNQSLVPLH